MPADRAPLKAVRSPYPDEVTPASYGRGEFFSIDYWRFVGTPTPCTTHLTPEERWQILGDWQDFVRDLGILALECEERDREALRIWNGEG